MSPLRAVRARRGAPRPDRPARSGRPAFRAHESARRDLFPLPLAPLEALFLQDESPSYPMQFFSRLRFRGRLRQSWLDEALHIAQLRHPLLTAIVDDADADSPCWRPCLDPLAPAQWIEEEPAAAYPPARFLDIRQNPGLRVVAIAGSSASDIILQFHHTACDGLGAYDFATDLLTAYANLASGANRYPLKPLDVDRLRTRGTLTLAGWQLFRWSMRRLPNLHSLWRFFRRRPSPVIPHRPFLDDSAPPPAFPETCVHHFSSNQTAAVARAAQMRDTTLNNVLVRDLFLTLAQLRKQNHWPDDAWMRLMVPINLRTPSDRHLPAVNRSSMFFLDRRLTEPTDAAALLKGIDRAMTDVKQHELGLAWLLAMRVLRHLPAAWANARRSRRRCPFSTVLTNLGPVLAASPLPRNDRRLVVGDLVLDDVEFIPITRSLQCLGLAVSTYAGRMTLGMRYDSRVLSGEQARHLMELYLQTIGQK